MVENRNTADELELPQLPITLYKYRPLEPFEYLADIICNRRFYAALFTELNDPMEGLFHTSGVDLDYLQQIRDAKGRTRICSFSETYKCPVLWAHYADIFKGLCIEIEISQSAHGSRGIARDGARQRMCIETNGVLFVSMDYSAIGNVICSNQHADFVCGAPHILLERKALDWQYEREARAFSYDGSIKCEDGIRITRILLGLNTPEVIQNVLKEMTPPQVSLWTTKISDNNEIEVDALIQRARR